MGESHITVPESIMTGLTARAASTGKSVDALATEMLAEELGLQHATIFQVSTATALVDGIYAGAVTVGDLKAHGNFGLGTFANLAGEMVVVDGDFYCVPGDGPVREAANTDPVPFAVVSQFEASAQTASGAFSNFAELTAKLDTLRDSNNQFYAVRIDGVFSSMHTRAVCEVEPGTTLVDATKSQTEFHYNDITGSVVGYWFPPYASSLNVVGWHLHFLDNTRTRGGHVLGVAGTDSNIQFQTLDDLHISLPETKEFLAADLTNDPSEALDQAERSH